MFYSLQGCNAILFIFDTDHLQKLTLKLSSLLCEDVLGMVVCDISTDSLFNLLQENDMRLLPPHGTIVDKGRKGKLHIFVYRFDKQNVTQCSKASPDDFKYCDEDEERTFEPELKLEINVAWSFFVLTQIQL